MDFFISDIVEHDPAPPSSLVESSIGTKKPSSSRFKQKLRENNNGMTDNGFPAHVKRTPSNWQTRLRKRGLVPQNISEEKKSTTATTNKSNTKTPEQSKRIDNVLNNFSKKDPTNLSEAEKIHLENLTLLASMTASEIEDERQELLNKLDPKVLKSLLLRGERRERELKTKTKNKNKTSNNNNHNDEDNYHEDSDPGFGDWIGGYRNGVNRNINNNNVMAKELEMEKMVGMGLGKYDVDKALNIKSEKSTIHQNQIESQPQIQRNDKDIDGNNKKNKKKVSFKYDNSFTPESKPIKNDDNNDDNGYDDLAPSYNIALELDSKPTRDYISTVHFTKPLSTDDDDDWKLDLDDPMFMEKLHDKYYPDLPVDPDQLKWMKSSNNKNKSFSNSSEENQNESEKEKEKDESIYGQSGVKSKNHTPNNQKINEDDYQVEKEKGDDDYNDNDNIYNTIADIRFDFNGDMISLKAGKAIPSYLGLHHHGSNPDIAGYTISELAHLARSSFAGQRCIAIRTLGRILYKLGKKVYTKVEGSPEEGVPSGDVEANKLEVEFEMTIWAIFDELRIIETIQDAVDEKVTTNLSVRNYAIDAIWLWKKGGGNRRRAN